jgi:hypothetical protein
MMDTKNTQIKSHGWHDVTLTGNLLTGDTFECRDFIKRSLGGKWDAQRKGWIVDLTLVARHTTESGTIWEHR